MARTTYFETTELAELARRGVIEATAVIPRFSRSADFRTKVLIVDDERLIADTLAAILNVNGFVADQVYCAEDALACMEKSVPDVLITDVIMPGMNGIELATIVRETSPQCEIFLLSGNGASLDIVETARNRGCNFTLLMKPIPPAELIERISVGRAAISGSFR